MFAFAFYTSIIKRIKKAFTHVSPMWRMLNLMVNLSAKDHESVTKSVAGNNLVESRNEGLRKPERKDQLGAGHEELLILLETARMKCAMLEKYLGNQPLEEARETFVANHV
jgi:hypothetical protein